MNQYDRSCKHAKKREGTTIVDPDRVSPEELYFLLSNNFALLKWKDMTTRSTASITKR